MTREERVGLWIIALFGLVGAAFYGVAIGPGYIRLVRTGTRVAPSETVRPAHQSGLDHAVRPLFGRLTGRLLDRRSHAPMPDGSITIVGLAHIAAPRIQQSPDGAFRVTGLPLGKNFELVFRHEGYSTRRLRHRLDQEQEIDVGLIELERFVLVEGRVRDRLGQGVIGARISWFPPLPCFSVADADGRRMALATLLAGPIPPQRQVFTDRSGRFSFGEMPPSPLDLTATAPGFGTALIRGLDLRHRTARRYLEIELSPASELAGILVDEHGQPLAGATLVAVPHQSTAVWRRSATDRQGRFRFDDLPAGEWALGAAHPECVPSDLGDVQVPGEPIELSMTRARRYVRLERDLPPGWWLAILSRRSAGELPCLRWDGSMTGRLATSALPSTLLWAAPAMIPQIEPLVAGDQTIRIAPPAVDSSPAHTVRIMDATTGAPVKQARLYPIVTGSALEALGESGESGDLVLREPPRGTASVFPLLTLAPGYQPLRIEWSNADPPQEIRLSATPKLSVRLRRPDGEPEPHGLVQVIPTEPTPPLEAIRRLRPRMLMTETDPSGQATVTSPAGTRSWRLVARGAHGIAAVDSKTITGQLRRGGRLEISLATGSWVSGTVHGAEGVPLSNVQVSVALTEPFASAPPALEPPPVLTVVTGPGGSFELGPLPPDIGLRLQARAGKRRAGRPIPPLEAGARVVAFDVTLPE